MDTHNVAIGFELRNLRIIISRNRDVAWFSALVDNEGEFDGLAFCIYVMEVGEYDNSIFLKQTINP